MKQIFLLLAVAVFAAGCGKTDGPKTADAGATPAAAGQPATAEAKACITEFLAQCGMQDVTVTQVAEAAVPNAGKTASDSWGYTFTAEYKNLFGETQKSENWVAVVAREAGKPAVRTCWDDGKNMVGGHRGHVETPTAELLPVGVPN